MCKVFQTTQCGSTRVWYHRVTKNNTIEILSITHREDESTMTYLQRFKEKMFNVERLVKPISREALINRLYNFD
jgi:(2Fe-2S) ferredoxin